MELIAEKKTKKNTAYLRDMREKKRHSKKISRLRTSREVKQ